MRHLGSLAATMGLVLCAACTTHPSKTSPAPPPSTGGASTAPSLTAAPPTTTAGPPGGPVPAGFQPSSVTFVSPDQGWALGEASCAAGPCTAVARTRDGGRTWQGIPAPAAAFDGTPGRVGTGSGVHGIRFAGPTRGWAFGTQVWATNDGGATWHTETLPGLSTGRRVIDIEVGDGGRALAALGDAGTTAGATSAGAGTIVDESTGGDTWTAVAGATLGGTATQLAVRGSSTWLVGVTASGAQPVWSHTGDLSTWATGHGPCPPNGGGFVALAPSSVFVACSGNAGAGSESKTVFVSADGGATFRSAGTAPRGGILLGAASPSEGVLVLAAASGASELYATADAGATWSTVFSAPSGGLPFEDLGFTTAAQGVAVLGVPSVGDTGVPASRLLMTRDAGRTWAPVAIG